MHPNQRAATQQRVLEEAGRYRYCFMARRTAAEQAVIATKAPDQVPPAQPRLASVQNLQHSSRASLAASAAGSGRAEPRRGEAARLGEASRCDLRASGGSRATRGKQGPGETGTDGKQGRTLRYPHEPCKKINELACTWAQGRRQQLAASASN
jgi:hypothetical protein